MKKILYGVIFMMVLLSGCAKTGDEFTFTGTIEANQIDVSSDIGGMIAEIKVEEGDMVKEGQVVLQLEDDKLGISTLQSEASYLATAEQAKNIKNGARKEEIDVSKKQLNMANIALQTAQDEYEFKLDQHNNIKKLYDQGAESSQKMDESALLLKETQAKLQNAQEEVQKMKLSLELLEKGATEESIRAQEYEVEKSKYAYEASKIEQDKALVTSKMEGIVLYKNFNNGEYLPKGSPVITLVDREDLWMKIYIPEKYMNKVKIGQMISLSSDILVDKKIDGKIVFISPEGEFTPSNVTTKEDRHNRVHEVKIKIVEPMDQINPGMILDAHLNDGIE